LFFCHFIAWNLGSMDAKGGIKGAGVFSINEMIDTASK
jgi:hypothetical protein